MAKQKVDKANNLPKYFNKIIDKFNSLKKRVEKLVNYQIGFEEALINGGIIEKNGPDVKITNTYINLNQKIKEINNKIQTLEKRLENTQSTPLPSYQERGTGDYDNLNNILDNIQSKLNKIE